jgi:hypothetical protein
MKIVVTRHERDRGMKPLWIAEVEGQESTASYSVTQSGAIYRLMERSLVNKFGIAEFLRLLNVNDIRDIDTQRFNQLFRRHFGELDLVKVELIND